MVYFSIVILLLLIVYAEVSWQYFKRQNKFFHIPQELQLVNLGSTYAYYGLNYENQNIKAFNMAMIPQYLYYDNILLKKYYEKIEKNASVLIVLPDFVFCVDGEKVGYKNNEYYLFLKPWEIAGFKIAKYLKLRYEAICEPILHEKKKIKEKWAGYVATYEEKEEHAKRRIADWEKNIGIKNNNSFKLTKELENNIEKNVRLVLEMITFCEKKNLKPTLVLMPMSSIMKNLLQENIIDSCLFEPIQRILDEKNVEILDYSSLDEFLNQELYLNSDCFNEKGRVLFTQKILKDLGIG